MYKYILFDFDGTVFDTVEGITKSVQYALAKRGIEAELDSLRGFAGPPLVDMCMENSILRRRRPKPPRRISESAISLSACMNAGCSPG